MKLRSRKSPLLLLLIPTLVAAAAVSTDTKLDKDAVLADESVLAKKYGTKDAPVDGKDGKPHAGPFLKYESKDAEKEEFPTLRDRPVDPTIVDGKKIPESNDGVMDDKNRPEPKKGTTGTGGGVSEKDKERKKKESQTGEKVGNKPQTPKEAPPLPHEDEEKILREKETKPNAKDDVSGLGVRLTSTRTSPSCHMLTAK
jgi:Ca2+/H+ antiporter, TMEM165/GDT1 family